MHLNYDKGITGYLNDGEQFPPFITQFNIESGICFSKVWRVFATCLKHNEGYACYASLKSQNTKLRQKAFKLPYYFVKVKTSFEHLSCKGETTLIHNFHNLFVLSNRS